MFVTPDFSEAAEFNNDPIPAGKYNVRIQSHETKTSSAGNNYLNWKLQIYGASDEAVKQNNRILFFRTMTSGKGAGFLKDFLAACGITLEKGAGFDPDTLLGKEVQVTVATKTKQDGSPDPFSEVKAVAPIKH